MYDPQFSLIAFSFCGQGSSTGPSSIYLCTKDIYQAY